MILDALVLAVITIGVLAAMVLFAALMFSLIKIWWRELVRISIEEKSKAYVVLFDQLLGKVTMTAVRETLQHSQDPTSSKIN